MSAKRNSMAAAIISTIILAGDGQASITKDIYNEEVVNQLMSLYGIERKNAINRLIAEEQASDIYRKVKSLEGYAGAWFDEEANQLIVATNRIENFKMLKKLGTNPILVAWSLEELESTHSRLLQQPDLLREGWVHALYVDYKKNRIIINAAPGQINAVTASLKIKKNSLPDFAFDQIEVIDTPVSLELNRAIRGGDGTRNSTFEQNPSGNGYYPCTTGVMVENGFYTAGHCGSAGDEFRFSADYSYLGTVEESSYPGSLNTDGDIAWIRLAPSWTPNSSVNAYSQGVTPIPAKWAGSNESPVGATVCRYGQTSGGPHCGLVKAKNKTLYAGLGIGYIKGITEVSGSCSSDGDSGGPWLSAGGNQIQGTNIGRSEGNTCPNTNPPSINDGRLTYFQPILRHISKYHENAGSILTQHGGFVPQIYNIRCPDMNDSGSGTFVCIFDHFKSQGPTKITWSGGADSSPPASWDGESVQGSCQSSSIVNMTITASNPYGENSRSFSFPCPMNPIP